MIPGKKTAIVIAGPTAVGKTAVAIQVAKHFQTEIISADSRQCFKELKIGVARPSEGELASVSHHFIASHSIHQKITAASFEEYALSEASRIFQRHNTVVITGGTGLYIKAFSDGMDVIPEVPVEIHNEILSSYKAFGMDWLLEEIKKHDEQFWEKGEIKNPQRIMRALEVVKATGHSIFDFRKGERPPREFDILKIALALPKEDLHRNINCRVDEMMKAGLLEEVVSLLPHQHLNALQTVGYRELFEYLDNKIPLMQAVEAIKQNTRHYAKRQLTWFKKDKEYSWLPPDAGQIIQALREKL